MRATDEEHDLPKDFVRRVEIHDFELAVVAIIGCQIVDSIPIEITNAKAVP